MRTERLRVGHPEGGKVLVKRSEQDSTDVNLIMDSWIRGAPIPGALNPAPGRYGDFSSGLDYLTALNAVRDAQSAFAALPPVIRDHVENDPGKLLDMWYDPERRSELEALGLVEALEPVAPVEPVVEDAKASEKGSSGEPSSPVEPDLTKSPDSASGAQTVT